MSTRTELLTPIGRLVQGSLYQGATTDAENKPLLYKSGPNMGQPRVNYWFSLAVQKQQEQHWNQTEWGKKIWEVGQVSFPNGQANSPHFAWKIIDGDSMIPNTQGNRPCDHEGFPGHWILKFAGAFAPSLFNDTGTLPLTEPNAIKLGDYVQVYGFIDSNNSMQQPGVYLNHSMIAHSGFGERIVIGADPKSVGFGNSPLPMGASKNPIANAFTSPVPPGISGATVPIQQQPNSQSPVNPAPVVEPYPAILTPPLPPSASVPPSPLIAPVRTMLPAAQGATYEQLISNGWTDALLIQHGLMSA
jgi:hypothetical protein